MRILAKIKFLRTFPILQYIRKENLILITVYSHLGPKKVKVQIKGRLDAAYKIIMEITFLIMEKSWNNHGILFSNFCGNPVVHTCGLCNKTEMKIIYKNMPLRSTFY